MTLTTLRRKNVIVQLSYTTLTLVGMVLLPIIVHLIPFSGPQPLGAYLLSMFIAPLVAAFYVSPVGLILAAILAPVINNALTGMPQAPMLYFVTGELIVFSMIVFWIVQKKKIFLGFSALAFLVAKLVVMVPGILILNGEFNLSVFGQNLASLAISIPGIMILFAVERLLLRRQQ